MIPTNHKSAVPTVELFPGILAAELVPPTSDARMSLHKLWLLPHAAFPPHHHPAPHLMVVLDGTGWAWQGKPTDMRPVVAGTVLVVPPHAPHAMGATGDGLCVLVASTDSYPLTDPRRLVLEAGPQPG